MTSQPSDRGKGTQDPSGGQRSALFDALKFFAIALVVFGHVATLPQYKNALGHAVYVVRSINMPLFMFMSGYLLLGREGPSPLRFVGRKFTALMVPYFAWAIFYLSRSGIPVSGWPAFLAAALVNPHSSSLMWFLYVLFVFYVVFTLARGVSKKDVWLAAVAVATVAIAALPAGDYFGRANVQWLFVFFAAGYLAAERAERFRNLPKWTIAGAFIVFCLLLLSGVLPNGGTGWPPWFIRRNYGLFLSIGRLSSLVFLVWKYATAFAGIAASVGAYSLMPRRWLTPQAFAGQNSLGIYVTQGWLLVLATGSSVFALLGSWILVLYCALAVALLLDQSSWTRAVFLGRWWARGSTQTQGAPALSVNAPCDDTVASGSEGRIAS